MEDDLSWLLPPILQVRWWTRWACIMGVPTVLTIFELFTLISKDFTLKIADFKAVGFEMKWKCGIYHLW